MKNNTVVTQCGIDRAETFMISRKIFSVMLFEDSRNFLLRFTQTHQFDSFTSARSLPVSKEIFVIFFNEDSIGVNLHSSFFKEGNPVRRNFSIAGMRNRFTTEPLLPFMLASRKSRPASSFSFSDGISIKFLVMTAHFRCFVP